MWALDLQFRGLGEATKLYRATMYVGTTKVVDLHLKGHCLRSASPTFANPMNGWAPRGRSGMTPGGSQTGGSRSMTIFKWSSKRSCRREYVKEGMVQAAIGRFPATDFTVIDREAIVSFGSQPEKDACTQSCPPGG